MRISPLAICFAGLALVSAPLRAQAPASISRASTSSAEPDSVSQVRIVRLSEVRGEVELARGDGAWGHAFANIPLVTGSRLRTGGGLAEVEFEDNSTLRLTPGGEVEFTELGRSAAGATITRCRVLRGTVFASLARNKAQFFTIVSGRNSISLDPGSHVRLEADEPASELAVVQGTAEVHTPSGFLTVAQKTTLRLNAADAAPTILIAKVEKNAFDGWDKDETAYQLHNAAFAGSGGVGSGFLYGSGDLNYYGSFSDLGGGCGTLWRPYFVSAAWDPYGAGFAVWYPGAGYSWVSPYPWGWLPFHAGSWQYCGAGGWGWNPAGSGWHGLNNWPIQRKPGQTPLPPKPPSSSATLLAVGTAKVHLSRMTEPGTFTFRNDSAGLGVPREVFGDLGKTSSQVAAHGFARADVGIGYLGGAPAARGNTGPKEAWAAGASGAPVAILTRSSGFHSGVEQAPPGGWSSPAASFAGAHLAGASTVGTSAFTSSGRAAGTTSGSASGGSSSGGSAHK